jgi:hypothetical protein
MNKNPEEVAKEGQYAIRLDGLSTRVALICCS